MRAAALSLLILAGASASASAQTVKVTPPTPPAMPAPKVAEVPGPQEFPSRQWELEVNALGDSIRIAARELATASKAHESPERIDALQQRLDALRGRLEAKVGPEMGRLGAMQGRLGAIQGRFGEMAGEIAAARAHAALAGKQVVVVKEHGDMSPGQLKKRIKQISGDPQGLNLPPADSIIDSDFAVAAGTARGRVAAVGDLDVFGTVNGDAISLDGDVIIHRGAHVTGDALAVGGNVRLDGGTIDGEMRSLEEPVVPSATVAASPSGFLSILGELQRVMGWLVAMVLLGFASMVFAEDRLRVVASTIEARFGKSLLWGLIAEVSFIPVLVLAAVLLAVTIIGIVLIPVALPAICVLTALLSVLGFLAVSRVAGQALTRRAAAVSVRGAELRSMLAGLFFFFGLWAAAAVLSWVPVLGALLHALAFVVTWAAATVGLGAAIVSRGGAGAREVAVAAPSATPDIGWQTPTPISGIAAARRPTSTTPEV
ncbi:MAG TPA: polymer-forming cytoskeletal protein [Gemmatimonadaceae bacterium]